MSDFIWIIKLRIKSDVFFCILVNPKNRVGIFVCVFRTQTAPASIHSL